MTAKDEGPERESGGEVDAVEAQISAFAHKLGAETEGKFKVYVYRLVRDSESGRMSKPFIKKYEGIEPDPQEIAEKFRGGKYLISFCWSKGKEHKSKSYTLDVDGDAFPLIPKASGTALQISGASGMSEGMQMQLAMMQTIGEVMKEAYRNGGNAGADRADPMAQFSGLMEAMESTYSRAMNIQQKVMERVFTRSMENRFGIPHEGDGATATATAGEEPAGIVGQYAPIIREVVEGLKSVMALFGEVPKNVIQKVKTDERFKALVKDQRALVVVGQALRKEFGDGKAAEIMNSFGVRMVVKPAAQIANTPDIPASKAIEGRLKAGSSARGEGKAQAAKAGNNGREKGKAGK